LSRIFKVLSSISLKEMYTLFISRYSNILILLNSISLRRILLIIGREDTIIDKGRGAFK
jgi:hypothetical protein